MLPYEALDHSFFGMPEPPDPPPESWVRQVITRVASWIAGVWKR